MLHCGPVECLPSHKLEIGKVTFNLVADSRQVAPTPRPTQLTPRPSPLTPLSQSPFDPSTAPDQSGVPDSWEGVCDWVLGKRLDLWQELFEAPFLKVQCPVCS